MYYTSRIHHLHPLPIFPSSNEEEEQHRYPPVQEFCGKETLEKMSILLSGSTLFIDKEAKSSPIRILKESVHIPYFATCRISQISTVSATRSHSL